MSVCSSATANRLCLGDLRTNGRTYFTIAKALFAWLMQAEVSPDERDDFAWVISLKALDFSPP